MRSSSGTNVGRERGNNEDSFLVDDKRRLFVVADGLGGQPAGEVASRDTVAVLGEVLSSEALDVADHMQILEEALIAAHKTVVAEATHDRGKRGMGTTAVVIHLDETESTLTCAHIGDSRAYLLRDDPLVRMTEDHSLGGENSHVLTQAIGASRQITPQATQLALHPGDKVLLCTDGLTAMPDPSTIRYDVIIPRGCCSERRPTGVASFLEGHEHAP